MVSAEGVPAKQRLRTFRRFRLVCLPAIDPPDRVSEDVPRAIGTLQDGHPGDFLRGHPALTGRHWALGNARAAGTTGTQGHSDPKDGQTRR